MKITKNNYLISLLFVLSLAPVLNIFSDLNLQSQSSASPTKIRDNKPVIYTINDPLKYFSDLIGGDRIQNLSGYNFEQLS